MWTYTGGDVLHINGWHLHLHWLLMEVTVCWCCDICCHLHELNFSKHAIWLLVHSSIHEDWPVSLGEVPWVELRSFNLRSLISSNLFTTTYINIDMVAGLLVFLSMVAGNFTELWKITIWIGKSCISIVHIIHSYSEAEGINHHHE